MEKIKFFHTGIYEINLDYPEVRKIVHMIIADHHMKTGMIHIIFSNDEYLLEMNRKFMDHDYYTDIITFNNNRKLTIGGELYISSERVDENARIFGSDFEHEMIRVIAHGILHLVGLDDKTEQQQEEMRQSEEYYLGRYAKNGGDIS